MSGEWIKMRVGLTTNPHVLRIAESLIENPEYVAWAGLSWGLRGYPPPTENEQEQERYVALRVTRYVTVTALLKFWGYANEHAKGDCIDGIRAHDILEITGVPGFSDALVACGWLEFKGKNGGARMPNFDEHNTGHRERTTAAAERQKRYRDRQKVTSHSHAERDVTRDVTVTPREEKRREDISNGKNQKRSSKKAPVDFAVSADMQAWAAEKVPGLDIESETDKFKDWEFKVAKTDWPATWRTWMRRAYGSEGPKTQDLGNWT